MKEISLKAIGIINILIPVPLLIITLMSMWVILFKILRDYLGIDFTSNSFGAILLLPILLSPALSIYGMVKGIKHRQEKHGLLCFILSLLGFLIMAAILFGIYYMASTYVPHDE
jgi:drug/metabolite transporter (DMT)-like permease